MYGMTDEFIDNQNALANAKARIAELEAELAALQARIAGGVEVELWLSDKNKMSDVTAS